MTMRQRAVASAMKAQLLAPAKLASQLARNDSYLHSFKLNNKYRQQLMDIQKTYYNATVGPKELLAQQKANLAQQRALDIFNMKQEFSKQKLDALSSPETTNAWNQFATIADKFNPMNMGLMNPFAFKKFNWKSMWMNPTTIVNANSGVNDAMATLRSNNWSPRYFTSGSVYDANKPVPPPYVPPQMPINVMPGFGFPYNFENNNNNMNMG